MPFKLMWGIPCGHILDFCVWLKCARRFVLKRSQYKKLIFLQQQIHFLSPQWIQTKESQLASSVCWKCDLLLGYFYTWLAQKNLRSRDWMAVIVIPFFRGCGKRHVSQACPRLFILLRVLWGVRLSDCLHTPSPRLSDLFLRNVSGRTHARLESAE